MTVKSYYSFGVTEALKVTGSGILAAAIVKTVRRIPKGKVASYGQVATAAGYPGYHRQVVQVLRTAEVSLPWHRVLGADGRIKLPCDKAMDQRLRLEMEGVVFRGGRVPLRTFGHTFR